MEIAICLGGDPLLYMVAGAPLRYGDDELSLLGAIRGEPVQLVKCETVDLEVPASAEIVIEGVVYPKKRRAEGPFGEFNGYIGGRSEQPIFHATCITHRNDYIWPGTFETKPVPLSEDPLIRTTSRDMSVLIPARRLVPEIRNFHAMISGCDSFIGVAQIDGKPRPHFARRVMDAIWATPNAYEIKILIVVDKDIDIYCLDDVMWAVSTRMQPHSDLFVANDCAGFFYDPSTNRPGVSSRVGIDATIKIPERFQTYPTVAGASDNLMKSLDEKFREAEFYRKIMSWNGETRTRG